MESRSLVDMVFGFMPAQVLYATAELELADALARGPRSYPELAHDLGVDASALKRLLRALTGMGIAVQLDEERFELTEYGRPLCSDAPDSVRGLVLLFGGPEVWKMWGELSESLRTGEPAWHRVTGVPPFEYLAQRPDRSATFNRAMAEHTREVAPHVIKGYDFARFGVIADLGGGDGTLIASILAAAPEARGILFDLPAALKTAPSVLDRAGVANRCRIISGDFFEAVPSGADAYVLKSVIHDWNDEQATAILRNCRTAMEPGARLLLVEFLMPPIVTREYRGNPMSDLNMLLNTGGRERTADEFETLLSGAGFALSAMSGDLPPFGYRVIEAVPSPG